MELKTPLYDTHVASNGKIVPFAGYLLPVQYETGVVAEHMAVRQGAGLFDVSHMGEVTYEGKDALANINKLLVNDFSNMVDGQVRYSPMCNDKGGIVDDLIVYRFAEDRYMIVVNAANREKDVNWMKAHLFGDVKFEDVSDSYAQIALQGPKALGIIKRVVDPELIPPKYYTAVEKSKIFGKDIILSKTGYTGESGVEIYCKPEDAAYIWAELLKEGKEEGLIPCGLGARDTLRLEAAMPLYGHEMTDDITPYETSLGNYVKMEKEDFIGKSALVGKEDPSITRVGLKITGKGIAREHCDVYAGDKKVGYTTSGTHCPFLGYAVAMAIVDKSVAEVGTALSVDVRGRKIECEVVALPFYKKPPVKKTV